MRALNSSGVFDETTEEGRLFQTGIVLGKNEYGHGGHLGHVTSIMSSDFHFLVPESFHTKFSSEWPSSF